MRSDCNELRFTKMQSCGNDYIYINCMEKEIDSPEALAVRLSDRRYGIGGDGVILILPADSYKADARMRMFNLDGSEGLMCGNGIRCVAKYLFDRGIVPKHHMKIDTLSGVRELFLTAQNSLVSSVKVNMGPAVLTPEEIPVLLPGDCIIGQRVVISGEELFISCVSMGNPHAVIFRDELDSLNISELGPKIESSPLFPQGVNIEFVTVINGHTLKMRVWERGSGETLACGTGACAAAVAAVLNGYCKKNSDIKVCLLGGELMINYTDEAVFMTGGCEKVFEGTITI